MAHSEPQKRKSLQLFAGCFRLAYQAQYLRHATNKHAAILGAADDPPAFFPCSLSMSISNSEEAQALIEEEQILHHHAAMVKRDLEAYCAYSRNMDDWKDLFKDHLVCFILRTYFYR